ncbi:MAG: DUF2075 domain-containing protein [Methanosarcinaceae archaeon]|nr:DUF2075 domain-containing protein [Methanosarcinaceae archaeon]
MIIYSNDVDGFKNDMFRGVLIDQLDRQVRETHHRASRNEIRAWENSLQYMNTVISNANVPGNSGIAIEYMIPSTAKRIDFIISGYDESDKANVVIVELKQWDEVSYADGVNNLVETYVGGGFRMVAHPCYQAWSYAKLLTDFNESVQTDDIRLNPCAYLHNYLIEPENDPLLYEDFSNVLEKAPLFDKRGGPDLAKFISQFITKGDDCGVLYHIENGRIKPSKSLQDKIASMISGNREFTMIDDQKVVFERCISMAEKSGNDGKKRVFIVEGGPGTGKTVVAINLLAELTRRGMVAQYITKNSAPRNVYKAKLKGTMKVSSIDNLFRGPDSFYSYDENVLDIAIVDEAHRLRAKSGMFANKGENQIKEIIKASKCSIFFVDDRQKVTFYDIGDVDEIVLQANNLNAIILKDNLLSQFRCNGSDGYLAWIDDLLQIRETANKYFDIDYDFDVVKTPQELYDWVLAKNFNNKARILAGYCWEWPKAERNNVDFYDIEIPEHNFGISWNLNEGIWAISPESVNEAGCIHTSQGLEFDYVGVIIGPDMYFEDDVIKTDINGRAKSDQSLRGAKKLYETDSESAKKRVDEIIRNTYRALLTRGMKGCRVFCTDKNLAEYIKQRRHDKRIMYRYEEAVAEPLMKVAERKRDEN